MYLEVVSSQQFVQQSNKNKAMWANKVFIFI